MNWKSYEDLTKDTLAFAEELGKYDMIVGVPRSGMLPASIIALRWNVMLASLDADGLLCILNSGSRRELKKVNTILVVDDSVNHGQSLRLIKKIIEDKNVFPDKAIDYVAIYGRSDKGLEFKYYEDVPQGRMFQWNWLYHKELLLKSCWDIDGCLCRKPTPEENDDGEKYRDFILNTEPKFIPTHPVGAIVTSRLEKFRPETEEWLKKNGVKYDNLIMLNYPTAHVRRRMGHHGLHKAEVYQRTNAVLFVEDEEWQAKQIVEMTGRPVLCVTNWRLMK